jgi:ubiquitin carboxyl-terminal hydrolase 7
VVMDNLKTRMHITAGIRNEGTTWYINSLLQTLFIIAPLRKAVFKMPSDEHNTIPLWLQRIFYNLKFSMEPVRITDLLRSFGWQTHEANTQHDVMEFNCILSENLEK